MGAIISKVNVIHNGGNGKIKTSTGRPYFSSISTRCPERENPQQVPDTFKVLGIASGFPNVLSLYNIGQNDPTVTAGFLLVEFSYGPNKTSVVLVHEHTKLVLFINRGLTGEGTCYWGTIMDPDPDSLSPMIVLKDSPECVALNNAYLTALMNCPLTHPCADNVAKWHATQRESLVWKYASQLARIPGTDISKKTECDDLCESLKKFGLSPSGKEYNSVLSKYNKLKTKTNKAESVQDQLTKEANETEARILGHEKHLTLLDTSFLPREEILATEPIKQQTHLPRKIAKPNRKKPASSPSEDATAFEPTPMEQ